jgi:hypothetical protein
LEFWSEGDQVNYGVNFGVSGFCTSGKTQRLLTMVLNGGRIRDKLPVTVLKERFEITDPGLS